MAYRLDENGIYSSSTKVPDSQVNPIFVKRQAQSSRYQDALFDMHKHILHILSLQQALKCLRDHGIDRESTGNIRLDILDSQQTRYGVANKDSVVRRMVTERSDRGVDAVSLRQSSFLYLELF